MTNLNSHVSGYINKIIEYHQTTLQRGTNVYRYSLFAHCRVDFNGAREQKVLQRCVNATSGTGSLHAFIFEVSVLLFRLSERNFRPLDAPSSVQSCVFLVKSLYPIVFHIFPFISI